MTIVRGAHAEGKLLITGSLSEHTRCYINQKVAKYVKTKVGWQQLKVGGQIIAFEGFDSEIM